MPHCWNDSFQLPSHTPHIHRDLSTAVLTKPLPSRSKVRCTSIPARRSCAKGHVGGHGEPKQNRSSLAHRDGSYGYPGYVWLWKLCVYMYRFIGVSVWHQKSRLGLSCFLFLGDVHPASGCFDPSPPKVSITCTSIFSLGDRVLRHDAAWPAICCVSSTIWS